MLPFLGALDTFIMCNLNNNAGRKHLLNVLVAQQQLHRNKLFEMNNMTLAAPSSMDHIRTYKMLMHLEREMPGQVHFCSHA